jgi:hypothetical protein
MKNRLLVAILFAGCTASEQHAVDQTITITPDASNVLTCSTAQFSAAVTGLPDLQVSWAATPGSVDKTGLYTSPMTVEAGATVTATSMADPSLSATAQITLATAFPSAAHAIGGSPGTDLIAGTVGIYQHEIAAHGDRVYTIWPDVPASSNTLSVRVARSDDGGATWKASVAAMPVTLKAGTDTSQATAECTAIAVDAANPDVIYATARISGASQYGVGVGAPDEPTLLLAVSTDGGATFTQTVLRASVGIGYCADISSPAPNTVLVADPLDECNPDQDIMLWSDGNRGASFATGMLVSDGYISNGRVGGLADLDGIAGCGDPANIDVQQNGNGAFGGEATESPRLFTNGAGRTCVTYIATTTGTAGTPVHTYVQCSDDNGATFTLAHDLDPASGAYDHSHSVGAFGPNHTAAIAMIRGTSADLGHGHVFVSTSSDDGHTWSAQTQVPTYVLPGTTGGSAGINPAIYYDADGVLWLAYRISNDDAFDRIVVDKSCDGGTTWSGAVLVNGTEQQISDATFANMKWPALIATTGVAPRVVATGTGATNVFDLAP